MVEYPVGEHLLGVVRHVPLSSQRSKSRLRATTNPIEKAS
jgi:hypothetical protein